MGERHLKLTLELEGRRFSAIRFGSAEALPNAVEIVYRLDINEFHDASALQLVVDHAKAA